MSFCTAINCMDGRVQLPVIEFLKNKFQAEYVDCITEPGPVRILTEEQNSDISMSILRRTEISVKKHKSVGIAVACHYDCAGYPVNEEFQKKQLESAVKFISAKYPGLKVLGLWIDSSMMIHQEYTNEQ